MSTLDTQRAERSSRISQKSPKTVSRTISFLQETNPEVFKVRPRFGGALLGDKCDMAAEEFPNLHETNISKDFKIQTAIDDCLSITSQEATLPNPAKDNMYVLGVIIGTIISLAATSDPNSIPKNYLKWLKVYLDNIRDDFGNHPPNIQGLLNLLSTLNLDAPDTGKTIRTTTRVSLDQGATQEAPQEAPPQVEEEEQE